jgi:hypothetical protein
MAAKIYSRHVIYPRKKFSREEREGGEEKMVFTFAPFAFFARYLQPALEQ